MLNIQPTPWTASLAGLFAAARTLDTALLMRVGAWVAAAGGGDAVSFGDGPVDRPGIQRTASLQCINL